MENSITQRIRRMLKHFNVSENSLASRLGISQTTINSALKDGKDSVSSKILAGIRENFEEINIDWLLTGEGEMLKTETEAQLPVLSYTDGVPYYDEDFLLGFAEIGSPYSENPDYLIRMPGYEKATLWCNASGHSMEPEISNGDIVALQRVEDFSFLPFGDVYGIITTNGMRTIKRLGRSAHEGCYRLIPTNKEYDEQEIPVAKIAMVYRVMGAMKPF